MTISAGNGYVRPRKGKTCGLVLRNRKGTAMEIDDGMAALALIVVGGGRKLIVVSVLVAVAASSELHLIDCLLAGGDMALPAFDFGMHSL